ncbi:thioredoxin family protein [Pseudoclavibacter helvolus]|uniref:thioredoxin family protein n=1 Tax=Pseudoclavibacter helvolus TaxID=255205 RepID=UPI003C795B53
MDAGVAALVLGALVVGATVIGFVVQRVNGRLKRTVPNRAAPASASTPGTASDPATASVSAESSTSEADLTLLPVGTDPGRRATLLLFSTEFCAKCPATRRMLDQLASQEPGVAVVEVDLTSRPDLARDHDVRQTPTVLVLDGTGARVARIGGPPRRAELEAQLLELSG